MNYTDYWITIEGVMYRIGLDWETFDFEKDHPKNAGRNTWPLTIKNQQIRTGKLTCYKFDRCEPFMECKYHFDLPLHQKKWKCVPSDYWLQKLIDEGVDG